jgi:phosphate transport system substrate-binding protein
MFIFRSPRGGGLRSQDGAFPDVAVHGEPAERVLLAATEHQDTDKQQQKRKEQPEMRIRGRKQLTAVAAVVLTAVGIAACGSSSPNDSGGGSTGNLSGTLNGSGSTFQSTFQQSAIAGFKSVQPKATVNYGGGGSGKGRSDLASGVVNFAGSDAPIPASEQANFAGKDILYFPVVIGPVTMSYNLSGVSKLQLTAPVIANIFEGRVTNWDNPAIAADNPGVKLPNEPITLAVRSDSSGTTENFSLFLEKAAPTVWTLGSASTISWPSTARAGNGNGGVAQIVKSTPGAIGYVDYADAKASGLTFASVQNSDGKYIAPSTSSASAAASTVSVQPNLTFFSAWAPGATSYPITYQSWVLVNKSQPNTNTRNLLKAYIGYLLGPQQSMLSALGYAPLPSHIDSMAKSQLNQLTS